jgi:P27 family predicted phage terminase small subunit
VSRAGENWAKRPKILEMWRAGATEYAIADVLGMSRASVQNVIRASQASGDLSPASEPQDSGTVVSLETTTPEPPERLGDAGKAVWRHVFAMTIWLDPNVDSLLVQLLCEQYDFLRMLEDAYRNDPRPTVQGVTKGSMVINPLIKEIRQFEASISATLKSLGLGPDSRIRLRTVALQGDAIKKASDLARPDSPPSSPKADGYIEGEW